MVNDRYILVNEKEIRELLDLVLHLFGIRAGYFYNAPGTPQPHWEMIVNRRDNYCEYCLAVRKNFSIRCDRSNDDFLEKAKREGKPLWYQCYNGLYEMYLPLNIDGYDAGFIHLGQVRTEKSFDTVISECGLSGHPDLPAITRLYNAMPVIEQSKLPLIGKLISVFAENIVRNRVIALQHTDPVALLEKYINDNAASGASIAGAAKYVGKSVSYVTHMFSRKFKMPFRDYLARRRIESAQELLTTMSIEDTAKKSGFKNRYHFTRVFRKVAGISPAQYRLQKSKHG
ncbi:MAG: PocR ligand-binding domain-containing protein [Spirochaetes bacterium]|nr:PocR ligand-binding domain-containing protein [Spirochaetota bacterium]